MTQCFAEQQIAAVAAERLLRFAPPLAKLGTPLDVLLRAALARPTGAEPLARSAAHARSVAVVVSDATRDEPRGALIDAVLELVPRERVLLVVAPGTHVADDSAIPERFADVARVVHDGRRLERTVELGRTSEGTPIRLLRELCEAELVVATGAIRPHYFAGFSGGVKPVFPGCAFADDVLANHRLKADESAWLGRADGNRCRLDMEQAARALGPKLHVLNVLADVEGTPVAAASGDPVLAHRELCARAREVFVVRAPRSPVVVVADRPPVTSSLYQASKLLAPAAALLEPGGTLVLLAECDRGVEPRERVNEGIYRLGLKPRLPAGHRVVLVSTLAREVAALGYAEPELDLPTALENALGRHGCERAVLLWRAGECIAEATRPGA